MGIAKADGITFTVHLVKLSQVLRDFSASRVFQDLCHDLIGPDVRLYWDQAVYKKPEYPKPFPWHQDNGYTYIEPQAYLTCWVALNDATLDNGCPWVIPGGHLRGTLAHRASKLGFVCREQDGPEALAVPVRAGSVVVFSSLMPHRTGPNVTAGVRKSYILQYAPDGARIVQTDTAVRRARSPVPDSEKRRARFAAAARIAALLLHIRQKIENRRVHLGRLLLLRPMPRALDQHGLAQVRHPRLHPFGHLGTQHDVELRRDHQRGLLDAIGLTGALLPAPIDASIPVQAAAKAALLERVARRPRNRRR